MTVDMAKHFTMGGLLKYTAPAIAMMIFTSIYGVVDGLFVSQFAGKTAFAAVNLIMPFIMILGAVGFMIGTGGSAIVAQTRGRGDDALANRRFSLLIYAALVLGTLFAIGGFVCAEWVARALGASEDMVGYCVLYARISMLSLPFFILQFVFQAFFSTAGKPQIGLFVVVAAGLTNILLDIVFVGLAGWGVAGAAFATVVGEVVGGAVPLIYFARENNSYLRLGATSLDFAVLGRACVNGSSELMTNIATSVVSMVYNMQLMIYLGADGVAAYGVIMYVMLVFAGVFMGYAMGSAPLMSFQFGAGNKREMSSLLKRGLGFVGVAGVGMCVAAQLMAHSLAVFFVGYDAQLMALTEHALHLYSIAFLLMGFSVFGSALFTSLGNGVVSAAIAFLRTLVFECGAVLFLPGFLGPDGIWVSVVVGEMAAFLVTTAFIFVFRKKYGYFRKEASRRFAMGE